MLDQDKTLWKMKSKQSISLIVPIYNEARLIRKSIRDTYSFMEKNFQDFEIIAVESGSSDGSKEICNQLENKYSRIKVIHENSRNGFGSALKIGFKTASKQLIWMMTVDFPFPLKSIFKALPLIENFDCILSYRSRDNRSFTRKFQSYIYNQLVKISLGLKVKHVNSAFKLYKADIIKSLKLTNNGWLIDAEIIYKITKNKIKYTEIPVELNDRQKGQSSIKFYTPLIHLKELLYYTQHKDD